MKYSKEFKIGLFAVVVLVVSYFLINYLRGEDIFDNEIEVCSSYGNVEGLVASAPVYIKGYKAGKVTEVAYDSETGDFNVTCSVSKEFRIPEDSKMTIYSVDIMGGKGVRIDLGCSEVSAEDGSYLSPSFEAGLMDGLASGVAPLLAKVTSTLDSLSVTVSGVNSVLSQENRSNIAGTLAHLESLMANVENISSSVGGKSDELAAFIDNLSSVSSKLEGVAERADTVMAGVSSVVGSLSESDIDGIISSFNLLLQNINDPEGTVGKLLVDKSVYDSVDGLLNDIDSLVRKIEENPKKYIRISVF
ncbi:MAG: MCE family protein [Bacteroidales bacterium]|nr:MCE family protein [Bacteroidales bacterium]